MARLTLGAIALLWGAGVLAENLGGALAVRGGIDRAGFVLALALAAWLVVAGARAVWGGLRARRSPVRGPVRGSSATLMVGLRER